MFRGPYEYSVRDGSVRFDRTTRSGNISRDSDLRIEDGRISGRVFHGPQKTWRVDVEVTYTGIPAEAATLAVILACDLVLRETHDGVFQSDD